MKDLLTYAAGVVVCSGFFTLFYRALLHRRTSFRVARMFLIGSLAASIIIPALKIPVWKTAVVESFPPVSLSVELPVPDGAVIAVGHDIWRTGTVCIYGLGIAVMSFIMAGQIVRIRRLGKRGKTCEAGGYKMVTSNEVGSPFSFVSTVYVGADTPPGELRQIMIHEASHIRHRHSAEKIAMEILKTAVWFNPFGWMAARLLNEVQEFEADSDALERGCAIEEYLPLIFKQAFGYIPEISTGLADSLTKKRFEMMMKNFKHEKYSWLRMAGVLPIAAAMLMLFGFTKQAPGTVVRESAVQMSAGDAAWTAATAYGTQFQKPGDSISGSTAPAAQGQRTTIKFTPPPPQQEERAIIKKFTSPQQKKQTSTVEFVDAEKMPVFNKGKGGLSEWLNENIRYPKEAAEAGISGHVIATFIVKANGSIDNIAIKESPHQLLSDEVVRLVGIMPEWEPGKLNGKQVDVSFSLPVVFNLPGDKPQKTESANHMSGTDRPFYWLADVNRELSAEEMAGLSASSIKSLSVIKENARELPPEIVAAIGSRKFSSVVIITLKDTPDESPMSQEIVWGAGSNTGTAGVK